MWYNRSNAEIGRFICADSLDYLDPHTVGGLNLYAYCGNNPVMNVDPTGHWFFSIASIVVGVVACFIPGGQAIGAALIACGTTSLASDIMEEVGVESETADIISDCLDIVTGTILLATPAASLGANMIGAGAMGLIGGSISKAAGGNYGLGSAIGNIAGSILGGQVYKGLVKSGAIPFKTSAKNIVENVNDPINNPNIGPKQGSVVNKIRNIEKTGRYDPLEVIRLSNGTYEVQNGHHNFRALKSLGRKYIWIKITK